MIRLEDGSEKRVGSQTECGLLDFARSQGADYGHLREQAEELLFIPFNSRRKRMTSAFPSPESEGVARVYVKGASEIILNMCTKRLVEGGEEREMVSKSLFGAVAAVHCAAHGAASEFKHTLHD